MKPLLDALGKAIKALQPVLWFVVVVAALLALLLLWYGNGSLTVAGVTAGGCDSGASDLLGLCTFINGPTGVTWITATTWITPTTGITGTTGITATTGITGITPTSGIAATTGITGITATPGTTAAPGQKQWIGLILLAALILIGVKVATWVIQGLISVIKWLRDKLFVQPDSKPPA